MTTIAHIDRNGFVLSIHNLASAPAPVLLSNIVIDKNKARQILRIQNAGKLAKIGADGEIVEVESVNKAKLLEKVREIRKPLLEEIDHKLNALFDEEKITGVPMDSDVLDDYCAYRKALRDVTEQADLANIKWPVKPWL